MKAALACGGWVVLMLLSSLLVGAECADGWNSPSIGRQGACSHHGGVVKTGAWIQPVATIIYVYLVVKLWNRDV